MTRKTILCVFGTRPEAIKMVPVVLALKSRPREFRVKIVATAQHRQMLDQVLSLFKVRPDHDLAVMQKGQSLTDVTVRALSRLESVFRKERPDLVLVHGDTTTTLAAALAAYYQKVPVGHVEAGLRSQDPYNPFPEEMNRRWADAIARLHFAPTPSSRQNLRREGLPAEGIFVTGNTGIDALRLSVDRLRRGSAPAVTRKWEGIARKPFVLVTAHRRENFGAPLAEICRGLLAAARECPDLRFLYPVHPNPQVLGPVQTLLGNHNRIRLLPALPYAEFLFLLEKARFVVTDSGGLQEEAPSLGKPVLVLRRVTERPEAVRAGTVRLVGTDARAVARWTARLWTDRPLYRRMAQAVNPYGDGFAARRTLEAIRYHFGFRRSRPRDWRSA